MLQILTYILVQFLTVMIFETSKIYLTLFILVLSAVRNYFLMILVCTTTTKRYLAQSLYSQMKGFISVDCLSLIFCILYFRAPNKIFLSGLQLKWIQFVLQGARSSWLLVPGERRSLLEFQNYLHYLNSNELKKSLLKL